MASVTVLKHWSLVLRSILFTSCVSQRRVQGHLLGMLLSLKNNSKNIVLLFWQYSSKNPCKHIVEPCHGTQWAPSACPCSCGWDRIGGQAGHNTKDRVYEELSSPSQRSQRRHCSVPDRPDSWELDGGKSCRWRWGRRHHETLGAGFAEQPNPIGEPGGEPHCRDLVLAQHHLPH